MNIIAVLPLLSNGSDDWGHPWWPIWPLFWAALIGTAIWLIVRRRNRRDPYDNARGFLAERFARGELSGEDYRAQLAELQRPPKGGSSGS